MRGSYPRYLGPPKCNCDAGLRHLGDPADTDGYELRHFPASENSQSIVPIVYAHRGGKYSISVEPLRDFVRLVSPVAPPEPDVTFLEENHVRLGFL